METNTESSKGKAKERCWGEMERLGEADAKPGILKTGWKL